MNEKGYISQLQDLEMVNGPTVIVLTINQEKWVLEPFQKSQL